MKAHPISWFLLVAGLAWLAGCTTVSKETSNSFEIHLADIPGISKTVLDAQGDTVQIEDPVPYFPAEKMYLFTLTVLNTDGFDDDTDTDYEFFGDAEFIAHFVREVDFVNEEHGGFGEKSVAVLKGGKDDLVDMVKGLVNIVFHPIDTAIAIKNAGPGVVQYFKDVRNGDADIREDAVEFYYAYAENVYMQQAAEFHLDYQELRTDEAKTTVQKLGNAKIKGMASTEILTLFVGWLKISKLAKAGEVAEAVSKAEKVGESANVASKAGKAVETEETITDVGKWAGAFEYGAAAELGASRVAKAASVANRISHLERLKPLLEPAKVASLQGDRALNSRLHKVLYWLNQGEKDGRNVPETLTRAMKMANADRRFAGTLLDPAIDRAQILKTYDTAKAMKIFEEDANLDLMRHGKAPWVNTPWGRQPIWVEHEIPVSWANELGNCWGNLSYETQKYNAMRGNKIITKGSMLKLEEYKNAGLLKQDRINEIIRTAVGEPATKS